MFRDFNFEVHMVHLELLYLVLESVFVVMNEC